MSGEVEQDEIRSEVRGRLAIVTLARPRALNALNLAMVERIDALLVEWADDPAIEAVLIRSNSERAFCAGGDMRSIGILPEAVDRMASARSFFGAEYRLNLRINSFPKPYIALVNGVVMGGGLGISVLGSHRVVSEHIVLAMPETVLGLFPNVGGSWFLNRCPGAIGRYLALIGPRLTAGDALSAGLATHHVPFAFFENVIDDLARADTLDHAAVDRIVASYSAERPASELAARHEKIDELFDGDDFDRVVANVDAAAPTREWIEAARAVLRRASPTSLRATWRRMVDGQHQSLKQVLLDDYRMAVRIVGGHDFPEGVRAVLIDKDGSSHWDPPMLAEVSDADIATLLEPILGEEELGFSRTDEQEGSPTPA